MIAMQFAVLEQIDPIKEYGMADYCEYNHIELDDNIYMNDWYVAALDMSTYFNIINNPIKSFNRWGVTLIPPQSLSQVFKICPPRSPLASALLKIKKN